jgi:hypothetical protein
MRQMELERPVVAGLEWSINEITDNVLNHASADRGGFVQVSTFPGSSHISFVVTDAGRGILSSMREGFPTLRADAEAIAEAVKHGVTRSPDAGQGNGLAGTLRIATMSGGSFKLTSGRAQLEVIRRPGEDDYSEHVYRRAGRLSFPGTVVSAELATDVELSLPDALGFDGASEHIDYDIVESAYTSADGSALYLSLLDETRGFGTRQAGAEVRTQCLNLLRADTDRRLVIDWAGIPLISSSFADEAFGRLFVELGPIAFGGRIQHQNIEPLVRSLVDRAIMQRASQATSREDGS